MGALFLPPAGTRSSHLSLEPTHPTSHPVQSALTSEGILHRLSGSASPGLGGPGLVPFGMLSRLKLPQEKPRTQLVQHQPLDYNGHCCPLVGSRCSGLQGEAAAWTLPSQRIQVASPQVPPLLAAGSPSSRQAVLTKGFGDISWAGAASVLHRGKSKEKT